MNLEIKEYVLDKKINWFNEYKKIKFEIPIGLITFFIIIKMYGLLLIISMLLVYSNDVLVQENIQTLHFFFSSMNKIMVFEFFLISLWIMSPFGHNLVVWLKKKYRGEKKWIRNLI